MKITPFGEKAYHIRDTPYPAYLLANFLNQSAPPGLEEAVACYETVVLHTDPEIFDLALLELPTQLVPSLHRQHVVRVCYELGPDLDAAATALGLPSSELIRHHVGTTFLCNAIGFRPGFPYLGRLPPEISGLPRLSVPRTSVPAGAVAITGRQTGIYPQAGPGGWWIIGRTPDIVADVAAGNFAISAGDEVTFTAIDLSTYTSLTQSAP